MSDRDPQKEQEFLYELLSDYSEALNELISDLTSDFQTEFGTDNNPLFLHIQLLAQHLGKAIASGPKDMRDELIKEAREQEQMVIEAWDEPEPTNDLANMPTKGEA